MAQNDVTTGNHPLVFYSSPVSLQVLASAKIAIHLWCHKIDDLHPQDMTVPWSWIDEGEPFSCSDCGDLLQRVPSAIALLIDDALKVLLKQTLSWVQKHSIKVFPWREERAVMAQIFYDVEVDDNDVITGRRLLACDRVTPDQKYAIATRFCLEEDVVRLWPLVEKNTRISEVTFEANEMIYFWNCMMKKIPPEVPGNPNDSINLRMISYNRHLTYPSIEYFWKKLTNEERILIVDNVLTRDIENEKFLTNMLPKLDHLQAHRVLENLGNGIIMTLAKESCSEYVIQVWTYFCEFASVEHQFKVLKSLFNVAYWPAQSYARRVPALECFRVSEILYEVWIRAPEQTKNYVIDNFVEEAFENLFDIEIVRELPEHYDRDMRFLLDLLGRVDLPMRNRLWCENWYKLIILAKPEYLARFMKVCFDTEEQIVRFKEGKMMDYDEIRVELQTFVEYGLFNKLSEYIRFCSNDPTRVENLRRRIIAPQFCVSTLSDREKCQKLVKFIDETFETSQQACTFKEDFLTSPECKMLKELYENLDKGCIREMINIRHFLHSKTRTDAIKQECLSHCKQCLVETKFVNFEVEDWRMFVLWCCETRDNWWAFRRSLPVDMIFEKLITKVIKGATRLEGWGSDEVLLSFGPVDNFFLWLYVKQDIVNKYKEAKLKNRSSKVIRTLLQKNWGTIVDTLLMWLLNNDKQRVEEVKVSIWSDEGTCGGA